MLLPTFVIECPLSASAPSRKSQRPTVAFSVALSPPKTTSPASDPFLRALYWLCPPPFTIAPFPSGPAPETTTVRAPRLTFSLPSPEAATSSAAPGSTVSVPSAFP